MRALLISIAVAGLAACSGGKPPELTASLSSEPPGAGHEIGGSIDAVEYDEAAGRAIISGWNMFTPATSVQDMKIFADNAVSIESVTRVERADVAAAIGNKDLKQAGFTIVLKTRPGTPIRQLCVSMTDKHYGARLLNPHSGDQPSCFPVE